MKTTLNIADSILVRAKRLAQREHVTLKSLTEQGLVRVLDEREHRQPAKLKPVTFKGEGLSKEFKTAGWAQIRDAAYEGRGS